MTPNEINAQLAAAAIQQEWIAANPAPVRKKMRGLQWCKAWAEYVAKWNASDAFAKCQEIKRASECPQSDPTPIPRHTPPPHDGRARATDSGWKSSAGRVHPPLGHGAGAGNPGLSVEYYKRIRE